VEREKKKRKRNFHQKIGGRRKPQKTRTCAEKEYDTWKSHLFSFVFLQGVKERCSLMV
jgi:hypothetical protein